MKLSNLLISGAVAVSVTLCLARPAFGKEKEDDTETAIEKITPRSWNNKDTCHPWIQSLRILRGA